MPQDSRRSVVYRSFVTCDDPKGVVECGTIRKYKYSSKKMKAESGKMPKNLNTSASYKEKEMDCNRSTEELNNPSSFHLKKVSKGAQKLNQVIDSWSKKGMSFDGQSTDIAKDLLKGALDLQDSLIMLGKLQEASEYEAKFKQKQKEKTRGAGDGELGFERSKSDRFGDQYYQKAFQKPRLSADGSSRDCYDELRKVIKDSFARQNLLPNVFSEEKVHMDRRKLDSSVDIPSTSSSQSSVVYSYDSTSSDSFLSSTVVPLEKPKGPNLIAKLMGLEEFPSKPLASTPEKNLERDKIFTQRRPMFDIDLPKARKSQFGVEKVHEERSTLDEIIGTMQCKGLLRSNKHQSYPNNTHLEKRLTNDAPPIVVIKPVHFQCLEEQEFCTCRFIQEEKDLDNAQPICRNWKIKEEVPSRAALNSDEIRRKVQIEESPIKRLIQEKGAKDYRETIEKPVSREAKNNAKLTSNKKKAFVPANIKLKKKEAIEEKVDKIQKATPSRRKPVEMEKMKSRSSSKSHDHSKVASTNLRKPENGSNTLKDQISQPKNKIPYPVSRSKIPAMSLNSCSGSKPVRDVKPVSKQVPENIESRADKDDNNQTDIICKNESDMSIIDTTLEVEFLTGEGMDACEILIEESRHNSRNLPYDAALLTTQRDSEGSITTRPTKQANHCMCQNKAEREYHETTANTKDIILRSPLFLSRAEELFNTSTHQCPVLQTNSLNDSETANDKLLVDCANELLEGRSLKHTPTVHPPSQSLVKSSRICVPLDQLVQEVCDGIEDLKSYSKLPNESLLLDTLHAMLGRDLWSMGLVNGAWDMGWRNGFNVDEIDQVASDLEKLVLSGLVEDLLANFVL